MKSVILLLAISACILAVWAGHGHQGYFQYANVPAYGQYEFGYHRGNPHHYTSRYEQGHNWRFRTKVRWGDKHGGYGEHYYDYNHVDKGHDKGHGKGHGHGWGHQEKHGHGHGGHGGHGHGGHGQGGYGHHTFGHGHDSHGHGHHASYSEQIPQVAVAKDNLA